MSTGSRATFVRVTGTADVVLTDNLGGTTTRANSIDQTFPLGLDTRTGGFTLVVDPTLPLANASGGSFQLMFDNVFTKITGLGFVFGPTAATYANDGSGPEIPPGGSFTHTNSVSTGFTDTALPYVGGEMHFSYTFTTSQEQ